MLYTRAQVQEACDKAVQKWEGVVNYITEHPQGFVGAVERGAEDCPLCHLFNFPGEYCDGCPIMMVTKKHSCQGTPYDEWLQVRNYDVRPARKLNCAQNELKFIRRIAEMYRKQEV